MRRPTTHSKEYILELLLKAENVSLYSTRFICSVLLTRSEGALRPPAYVLLCVLFLCPGEKIPSLSKKQKTKQKIRRKSRYHCCRVFRHSQVYVTNRIQAVLTDSFVAFLSCSEQVPQYCLKVGHDRFLHRYFLSLIEINLPFDVI